MCDYGRLAGDCVRSQFLGGEGGGEGSDSRHRTIEEDCLNESKWGKSWTVRNSKQADQKRIIRKSAARVRDADSIKSDIMKSTQQEPEKLRWHVRRPLVMGDVGRRTAEVGKYAERRNQVDTGAHEDN